MSEVQGDHKVSVYLLVTAQKVTVMFKLSPASLQTVIDTRLTLTHPQVATNQQLQLHATHQKTASVVSLQDGRLTPETCRAAFPKLWPVDHRWSSGSALVVPLD
jgi:hypothetical protein